MSRTWRLVLPALLGGLLLGVWIGSRCERAAARRVRREGPNPAKVMKLLRRELRLKPDQTEKVRAILVSKRPAFQALRRENAERMAALREEVDAEIAPLLDDAQKARQAEFRARWKNRVKEPGPPDAR